MIGTTTYAAPAYGGLAGLGGVPMAQQGMFVEQVVGAAPVQAYETVAAPVTYAAPQYVETAAPQYAAAPAVTYAAAPTTYAAPTVVEYAQAFETTAPAVTYAAPVSYAAPVVEAAPAVTYAAPMSYAAPVVETMAAPVSYAPMTTQAYAPMTTQAYAPMTTQSPSFVAAPALMTAGINVPAAPLAPAKLTTGIPTPEQIAQQKAGYAAALDKQLKEAIETVQKETQIEKEMIKFTAEKTIALYNMQVDEKLTEAMAVADEQATFALLELNKAKVERNLQLNAQANGLVMDYQMKAVQTELAQKQYAFQMELNKKEQGLQAQYDAIAAKANTGTSYTVPGAAVPAATVAAPAVAVPAATYAAPAVAVPAATYAAPAVAVPAVTVAAAPAYGGLAGLVGAPVAQQGMVLEQVVGAAPLK